VRGGTRFGPLKERPFRLLWFARTGSSIGDSLVPVALILAVLSLTAHTWALGVVLASRMIAVAVFTVVGGVWADRLPRRAVLISADLLRFGTEAITAALLFAGTAHVWQLAVLQSAAGVGAGFFGPASTALIPQTVTPGRLQQANSLLSLTESATRIVGPALSGLIVVAAGAGWCFAIDSASFLFSAAFVTMMTVKAHVPAPRQRFWREVGDGWREVRRHRWLTAGFLGYAFGNVGIGIYQVAGPITAINELGGGWAWGVIVMAISIGGVLGGLIAYRIRPKHPVAIAFAIWSAGAVLPFALAKPLPLAAVMATAAVLGASILIGNALWETAMQQEVQPDRLARVASIDILLSICLMPLGFILAGPLETAIGLHSTLLVSGLLMSIPCLCVLGFVGEVRTLERRDDAKPAAVPSPV
jgi:MFS family permease